MSRPRRHPDGTRNEGVRFPIDISDRLRELPNRSEFIVQAVEEKLGVYDDELLEAEISELQKQNLDLKERSLRNDRAIEQKEAILRSRHGQRSRALEVRVRTIEILKGIPELKRRNWLQSRIDVLNECGWRDAEEALNEIREALR